MEAILPILILLAVIAGFLFVFRELKKRAPKEDSQSMLLLQNQMNELARTLDTKLGESAKTMRDQLKNSIHVSCFDFYNTLS